MEHAGGYLCSAIIEELGALAMAPTEVAACWRDSSANRALGNAATLVR